MKRQASVWKQFIFITAALGFSVLAQAQEDSAPRSGIVLKRTTNNSFPSVKLRPLVLRDGRMVVSVADTVYMVAPNGNPIWKYATAGETLTSEPAYNGDLDEVALVGNDLLFVRLDATTGKLKWKADTVGRARFSSVTAYGKGFLVVVDMYGYRDGTNVNVPDRLEYWTNSKRQSWGMDFPVEAELIVNGNLFYSLDHGKDKVRLRELHVPAAQKTQP